MQGYLLPQLNTKELIDKVNSIVQPLYPGYPIDHTIVCFDANQCISAESFFKSHNKVNPFRYTLSGWSLNYFTNNCGIYAITNPRPVPHFVEWWELFMNIVEAYIKVRLKKSMLIGSDGVRNSIYQRFATMPGWEFGPTTHNRNYMDDLGHRVGCFWKMIGEFDYPDYGFSRDPGIHS